MKIYGHFLSSPANQVRLTASALGAPHEYVHVDLQNGEQMTPEYRAINPFGKVPALDDNGFHLAESNAICRYLAHKQGAALYSADPKQAARIDQWMDFSTHHVRSNMGKVLFNKMFAPMFDMPVNEAALAEGLENLNANLGHVETALSQGGFLASDALTLADIALIAAMEPFEKIEFDMTPFPATQKMRQSIMGEDWYTSVHAHYGAEMQG